MKRFNVDVDVTMSCRIEVDAESEEQAKTIVANRIGDDPWQYVRDGHYMSHEFEAVNESEEPTDFEKALAYVREQLEPETLAVIKAQIDRSYRYHMAPSNCVTDDGKVIDLLEEWGADNDLPEGWWENEADIDDVLLKL
ncbi:MAG: hypothetical protein IJV24_07000 [Prevotella sp.]|nr:hypothetical protein [Prevotella sp.]